MIEVLNLGSGSKGNATIFRCGQSLLLIDDGLPKFKIKAGVERLGLTLDDITDILVTHNHGDHTKGLIYIRGTIHCLSGCLEDFDYVPLAAYKKVEIGGFEVTPIKTSHDAPASAGYILEAEGKKIVYLTDTGKILSKTLKVIGNADCYIFESNYDMDMLLNSGRPKILIDRIKGDKGHLGNLQSAEYLSSLVGERTKIVYLAHLSEECNTEETALETHRKTYKEKGLPKTFGLYALRQWEETYFTL